MVKRFFTETKPLMSILSSTSIHSAARWQWYGECLQNFIVIIDLEIITITEMHLDASVVTVFFKSPF